MEALNYAKDMHKPIVAIFADHTFRPYGALGAITASATRSIVLNDNSSFPHAVSDIANTAHAIKKTNGVNVIDISQVKVLYFIIANKNDYFFCIQINDTEKEETFPMGSSNCTVLICATDDGDAVAQLIFESLTPTQPSVIVENLSKPNATCSVANCTVFVAVLTPQLEQTSICQSAFEEARRLGKPIVPVIAVKKWRPTNWLGLIIAGRIFFRIFDQETAYKPFYDSNRITDLRVEIEVSISIYSRNLSICLLSERLHVYQLQAKLNVKKLKKKHLRKKSMNVRANYQHGLRNVNHVLLIQSKLDNPFEFN
jgi:hypothetical protein